ncbi:MAG TPA: L-threonylcarbamoyladenylate synthase [Vicinamibacteria bacterium]|nr:L-threonylcarbamoyladenylate synthase [Vicinamibacteria bacterium]
MAAEIVTVSGTHPDPSPVARAAEHLAAGHLVIYPTDTLYAIGGRALDGGAVRAVRSAKGREEEKPLPVIAADLEQARSLCAAWPPEAEALASRFWPGPLTLILGAAAAVPAELTAGTGTIAVRVPALEVARALCRAAGPLVSTSANLAGEAPGVTCAEAVAAVGASAALALDGGAARGEPSTLVDLTVRPVRIVRPGAVPWSAIEGVLPSRGR